MMRLTRVLVLERPNLIGAGEIVDRSNLIMSPRIIQLQQSELSFQQTAECQRKYRILGHTGQTVHRFTYGPCGDDLYTTETGPRLLFAAVPKN